ncbi:hypothetical protein BS78_01G257900 [Paspalum vaginatum]|nr:hypothetical protein BS78_01G257900 [Paspalum vaginatum]
MLVWSCQGKSGGLALYWSNEHCVCLQSLCSNFIDLHIKEALGIIWRATFVYGEPKTEHRHVFWDRMHFLRAQWEGPWVCIGDFNEVLCSEEHLGPSNRGENQMRLFRECLEDCQLVDLGFAGQNTLGIIDKGEIIILGSGWTEQLLMVNLFNSLMTL